jgi:hypothetical protein
MSIHRLDKPRVWSLQREYKVGVRWSPDCKDVSPEAEERPTLKAVTKQRDWEHWSECNSNLWGVDLRHMSVQYIQSSIQNPSIGTQSHDLNSRPTSLATNGAWMVFFMILHLRPINYDQLSTGSCCDVINISGEIWNPLRKHFLCIGLPIKKTSSPMPHLNRVDFNTLQWHIW